jgi:hypothetical protein
VGRRLLAFGLTVAIQAAAVSAPLVHAHLDDHHADHHRANGIHAHLHGHDAPHSHPQPDQRVAIHAEEARERAVTMPLFVAVHVDAAIEPALAESRFDIPAAADSLMRRPPEDLRSHGPPLSAALSPRAPPVFSVLI